MYNGIIVKIHIYILLLVLSKVYQLSARHKQIEMDRTLTYKEFLIAAENFVKISDKLNDGWQLIHDEFNLNPNSSYLRKECYINDELTYKTLKAEYIVFYNLSYGVPSFSFNIWDSSGVLFTLEDIRNMAILRINKKDFYSVITQQEHPLLSKPYFIMHPCQTEALLSILKDKSKNIIVTFLGLITPLLQIKLSMEYGR